MAGHDSRARSVSFTSIIRVDGDIWPAGLMMFLRRFDNSCSSASKTRSWI